MRNMFLVNLRNPTASNLLPCHWAHTWSLLVMTLLIRTHSWDNAKKIALLFDRQPDTSSASQRKHIKKCQLWSKVESKKGYKEQASGDLLSLVTGLPSHIHEILRRNSKTKSMLRVLIKSVKTKFSCTYIVWKLFFSQYSLTVSSTDENQVMFSLECIKKIPTSIWPAGNSLSVVMREVIATLKLSRSPTVRGSSRQKLAHTAVSWGPSHSLSKRL